MSAQPVYAEMQVLSSVGNMQDTGQLQQSQQRTHGLQNGMQQHQPIRLIQQKSQQPSGLLQQQQQHMTSSKVTVLQQPSPAHTGASPYTITISCDQNSVQHHQQTQQQQQQQQQQHLSSQVVYQSHYGENSANQVAYQSNQIPQQSSVYMPSASSYYESATVTTTSGSNRQLQGQIFQQQGKAYVLQGMGLGLDVDSQLMSTTPRASPATVQWLMDNYETAEGVSLPRSTLYNHYLRHCHEIKIEPMNQASFGKLIRSVFLGLRTRRLGTRGNSKYHYYGVRIKATSNLNEMNGDQKFENDGYGEVKRFKSSSSQQMISSNAADSSDQSAVDVAMTHQHQQFLGDASAAIPHFGHIDVGSDPLPDDVNARYLGAYENLYAEHCEAILSVVVNLQFHMIETLWKSFWRTEYHSSSNELEHILPAEVLYSMSKMPAVLKYTKNSDYAFYQALVEVLIPDVLRPIPSSLTQVIRNFAKSLESCLRRSMKGVPDNMVDTKVAAVTAFSQTLRRYTSLNHLAQAARAVLQNTAQVSQMLADLNRVDFANIQEQASWVCQCDDEVARQLELDMKRTLQQQNSLEQWAEWLESVVNSILAPLEDKPNFAQAARQFLLKWSFYSSMIIRDLTLRSAASFGSFHLIRLLYDEYMFYLIEHKVAEAAGETPIATMGESRQNRYSSLSFSESDIDSDSIVKLEPVLRTGNVAPSLAITSVYTIHQTPSAVSNHAPVVQSQTVMPPLSGCSSADSVQYLTTSANDSSIAVRSTPTQSTYQNKTIVVMPAGLKMSSNAAQPLVKHIKIN